MWFIPHRRSVDIVIPHPKPSAIDTNYETSRSMFDVGKWKKITTSLSSPSKASAFNHLTTWESSSV